MPQSEGESSCSEADWQVSDEFKSAQDKAKIWIPAKLSQRRVLLELGEMPAIEEEPSYKSSRMSLRSRNVSDTKNSTFLGKTFRSRNLIVPSEFLKKRETPVMVSQTK